MLRRVLRQRREPSRRESRVRADPFQIPHHQHPKIHPGRNSAGPASHRTRGTSLPQNRRLFQQLVQRPVERRESRWPPRTTPVPPLAPLAYRHRGVLSGVGRLPPRGHAFRGPSCAPLPEARAPRYPVRARVAGRVSGASSGRAPKRTVRGGGRPDCGSNAPSARTYPGVSQGPPGRTGHAVHGAGPASD